MAPLVSALTLAGLMLADRAAAARLLGLLRPAWGLPLAAAVVAPWVVALANAVGWHALLNTMAGDIFPKITAVVESHGGPPGLYLLLAPATFWPGSLALVFAIVMAWRRRHRPAERFLLAWLAPTWLFFECMSTKLPHYVLPAFPALALLAARAASTAPRLLRPPIRHAAIRALLVGWALMTVALGLVPAAAAHWLGASHAAAAAALSALAAVAIAAVCLRLCWSGKLAPAGWLGAVAAVVVYVPLWQWTLPRLDALWLSRSAAAAVARAGPERRLAAVGYAEPSLVFLTSSDITFLDAEAAAAFLAQDPRGLELVASDQLGPLATAANRRGLGLRTMWSGGGLNYTKGRWLELRLLRIEAGGGGETFGELRSPWRPEGRRYACRVRGGVRCRNGRAQVGG